MNLLVPFGRVNNGAEVSLYFKILELFSHASDHLYLTFFWFKVVKGDAMGIIPTTNLLFYPAKPKKLLMSFGVNGLGQFFNVSVFLGSTSTSSLEMI